MINLFLLNANENKQIRISKWKPYKGTDKLFSVEDIQGKAKQNIVGKIFERFPYITIKYFNIGPEKRGERGEQKNVELPCYI